MKANSREDAAIRLGTLALLAISILPQAAIAQIYPRPTYSSPIAVSRSDLLIWVVNPSDDSVSVIRPDNNTRITKISVGDEPESIALTPNGQYAYVANAAGNNVTVIRIQDPAWGTFSANVITHITTGAEPWNIVTSPDGLRVFVANSAQDTVTVIDAATRGVIGHVDLRNSIANDPDRSRHFQPRGLAVTADNSKLYVTRFLSFTKAGGRQGDDFGKEGLVAVLDINTSSANIADYIVARTIPLAAQVSGFLFPGLTTDTAAFPNQLQSIVIRGDSAYLANIAASPTGPLRFNLDTHAFVNQIGGVTGTSPTDLGAVNLHLGARDPEPGKDRLFFANPWALAFNNQSGAGNAYVVSAGSDLLIKLNVDAAGTLGFTGDSNTTRYIDLNDPTNSGTSGLNAGKNPQGIAINSTGTRAYVANFVSRNVSVVDLTTDSVIATVQTSDLPAPGSPGETNLVGAEMFFSSRGNFDPIPGTNSLRDRLSSEGWQSCASCHFKGLTDGVIWQFAAGPRKSVPLNSSFNPQNRSQQRLLNYSAIFDEIEDFEINVRNVSGPGPLAGGALDPNHGLLIGDNGDLNAAPSAVNAFALPNANRQQVTVTLPGSTNKVPALTAMREWVRLAVRTPNAPVTGLPNAPALADIAAGRALFSQAGCVNCHGGQNWTVSLKDFTSPPPASEINTERTPPHVFGNPVGAQYLNRFLRDIGSFNLGVPGQGNPLGNNVGADEKAAPAVVGGVLQAAQDGLGIDYNGDGRGVGFNVPSLLGISSLPPFMHNGAAESLAAVVADVKHRTDNGRMVDRLSNPADQAQVVKFLESIDVTTVPLAVPIFVFINEWMAANTSATGIADPADGHYEDWFELYNPTANTVDLAGYFLTDTLTDKFKFPITANMAHSIPPRGYLLVWADGEPGQNLSNGVPRLDLHVNFTLAAASEAIGLFAADGTQINAITFTNQADNVSEGRSPDGSASIIPLPTPSPGTSNAVADITPPMIACPESITRQAASLAGVTVNFTVTATDNADPSPAINCSPASGSLFPIGNTLVTCTATDTSGNIATCTFTVTVQEIAASPTAAGPILTWNTGGILEEADAPLGPWFTVPEAQSPYTVPLQDPSKFYRLRYVIGPRISKVEPSFLKANDPTPTELYIFGLNLSSNSLVRVNGQLLTGITLVGSNVVRGVVSSLAAGVHDVEVVNGSGAVLTALRGGLQASATFASRIDSPPGHDGGMGGDGGGSALGASASSIQLGSGEFKHTVVDLVIPGRGLNFVWQRTYRSRLGANTAQGIGWDFNYNLRIEQQGSNLVLHANGRADVYRPQGDGTYACDGFSTVLVREPNGSFKLVVATPEMGSFVGTTDTNALELGGNPPGGGGSVSYSKIEDLLIVAGNPSGQRNSSLFTTTLDFGPTVAPSGQGDPLIQVANPYVLRPSASRIRQEMGLTDGVIWPLRHSVSGASRITDPQWGSLIGDNGDLNLVPPPRRSAGLTDGVAWPSLFGNSFTPPGGGTRRANGEFWDYDWWDF